MLFGQRRPPRYASNLRHHYVTTLIRRVNFMNRLTKFLTLSAAIFAFSFVNVNAQNFAPRTAAADSTIERQVYKKILQLPRYGVFDFITFSVNNGTVVLDGKTISLGTRSAAASTVKRIPGVVNVVNNIDELPLSGFDRDIRRQALYTFASRGLGRYFHEVRPDVHIIVENGRITLEGYVYNKGDYDSLNIYAHGIPGVFSVQNNLKIGKDVMR
jgi:hyperosmotically inducible protein